MISPYFTEPGFCVFFSNVKMLKNICTIEGWVEIEAELYRRVVFEAQKFQVNSGEPSAAKENWGSVTMLQCYTITMLKCYTITILQCNSVIILRCYSVTVYSFQCFNVTILMAEKLRQVQEKWGNVTIYRAYKSR